MTCCLMLRFREGSGCENNESLDDELLERALDLGSFFALCHLVENREMEKRTMSLMSFVGLHVSAASDEIFSELWICWLCVVR